MNARSNSKQAILTILALLVPVAIFLAAAPTSMSALWSSREAPADTSRPSRPEDSVAV